MAAGQAAAAGAQVLLLERTGRLGTKLRITGKGRCNLTNTAELDDFLAHFAFPDAESGASHLFLRNAFARFFAPDLVAFFEDLGVPTVVERGGRVFPGQQRRSPGGRGAGPFRPGAGRADPLAEPGRSACSQRTSRLQGVALEGGERIAAGPSSSPRVELRIPRPVPAAMATGWPSR